MVISSPALVSLEATAYERAEWAIGRSFKYHTHSHDMIHNRRQLRLSQ